MEVVSKHTRVWSSEGESELLKIVRSEALRQFGNAKGTQTSQTGKLPSLHELVYEIFDELTSVMVAKGFWKKLLAISGEPTLLATISAKLSSVVLDVLVVQETEAAEVGNAKRHTFLTDLMKAGLKEYLVKNVDIVWRFSISSAAAILGVAEPNLARVHRVATSKHFFTLPKHNLLREESEGYSKLISTLLTADFEQQPQSLALTLTDLIGAYALHPSRVLDLVLSASGYHLDRFFENHFSQPSFADYERALAPIRMYLDTQDAAHMFSLLGFHVRHQTWTKDGTSATIKPPASGAPATAAAALPAASTEPIENLAISTCRIFAMLVRFGHLQLSQVWSLLHLPATRGDSKLAEEAEMDGDQIFGSSAKIQLLTALLEIPDDEPLAFLRQDSVIHELFIEVVRPNFFRNKRVSSVFSKRLVFHLQPILTSLMASNQLELSLNKQILVPTLQTLVDVLFDLKDVLCMMSETISGPLHHLLCLLCGSIIDGVIHSGEILSELDGHPRGVVSSSCDGGKEGVNVVLVREIEKVSLETMSRAFGAVEDVMTQVILPSFVCLEINADGMWKLLQKFPFEFRNRVYHSWGKMMRDSAYPGLTSIGTDCRLKVRGMMKRMTDTSIKETGRPLCKFGNKFPPVLSDLVSSLVFPNFVQPLAESMRYLSDLSLDVLIYACLDAALNMPASSSSHFANVATFIAAVMKLHYERLDIVPLLEVIEQLVKRSKLTGATLFSTLLSKMGCVDILEETASTQIRMVNSFPSLHTLGISGALQAKETSRSSIVPLRDRLWSSNSWLPLYILILQLEQHCAFHSDTNDLTFISHSLDSVHQLSLQLAEFTSFIFKQYAQQVNPSLLLSAGQIAQEYHVPFPSVLHLFRPILHLIYPDVAHLIGASNPLLLSPPSSSISTENDNSIAKPTKSKAKKTAASRTKKELNTQPQNQTLLLSEDLEHFRAEYGRTIVPFPIDEKLQNILDALLPPPDPNAEYYIHKTDLNPIKDIFPMTSHFLVAFWGLKLIDVECNESLYRHSISQQNQAQQSSSSSSQQRRDKSFDISPATLEKDLNAHLDHVHSVFDRLKSDLSSHEWFDASLGYRPTGKVPPSNSMDVDGDQISEYLASLDELTKKKCIAMAFLQHCIIPRAMISADDALYCAAFIKTLHRLNPSPLWDTGVFMDVFLSIMPLMFSSASTNESGRFGRLVCSVFEMLVSWRDFAAWQSDLGGRDYSLFSPQSSSTDPCVNSSSDAIELGKNAMEVDSPLSLSKSTHSAEAPTNTSEGADALHVAGGDADGVQSETTKPSTENSELQSSSKMQSSEAGMDVSSASGASMAPSSGDLPLKVKTEDESPWRLAHRAYCLKSIQWEKTMLDHVMEGITKPVDRWMRRAILFSLKEMNSVFPTSERFCVLLNRCVKANTTGSDDVKALANSYQNLLEAKAKSAIPHHQFQLLFPGFIFPDAPIVPTTEAAAIVASETKSAPSAYSTSTVDASELSDYRNREYGQGRGRYRQGYGSSYAPRPGQGNSSAPSSTASVTPSAPSHATPSAVPATLKPAAETDKGNRTTRGRGTSARVPDAAPPAPPALSASNASNNSSTSAPSSSNVTTQKPSTSSNSASGAASSASGTPSAPQTQSTMAPTPNTPSHGAPQHHSREHGFDRPGGRDLRSPGDRDPRDHRDVRNDHRDGRDGRDHWDARERGGGQHRDFPRDFRDAGPPPGPRDFRDREYGGVRDGRDGRDGRDQREQNRDFGRGAPAPFDRDRDSRDVRDTRDTRDPRDVRDRDAPRDARTGSEFRDAPRDNRDVRDTRDTRDTRDFRGASQPTSAASSSNAPNLKKRGRNGEPDLPAPEPEKRPKTAESSANSTSSRSATPSNPSPAPSNQKEATIGPPLPPAPSRPKRR